MLLMIILKYTWIVVWNNVDYDMVIYGEIFKNFNFYIDILFYTKGSIFKHERLYEKQGIEQSPPIKSSKIFRVYARRKQIRVQKW